LLQDVLLIFSGLRCKEWHGNCKADNPFWRFVFFNKKRIFLHQNFSGKKSIDLVVNEGAGSCFYDPT
jgi:hypothetical protein